MQAIAISNGYTTGKVYIIWEIPHDKINGFEIYRDGKLIASSLQEEGLHVFVPPTMFDHDHQTNLFRKDSPYKLMYVDENVYTYQHYEYQVVALKLNEENEVMERIESNTIGIQAQ
jgi:hypothetical protein